MSNVGNKVKKLLVIKSLLPMLFVIKFTFIFQFQIHINNM